MYAIWTIFYLFTFDWCATIKFRRLPNNGSTVLSHRRAFDILRRVGHIWSKMTISLAGTSELLTQRCVGDSANHCKFSHTHNFHKQHCLVLPCRVTDDDGVVAFITSLSTLNDKAAEVFPGLHSHTTFTFCDWLKYRNRWLKQYYMHTAQTTWIVQIQQFSQNSPNIKIYRWKYLQSLSSLSFFCHIFIILENGAMFFTLWVYGLISLVLLNIRLVSVYLGSLSFTELWLWIEPYLVSFGPNHSGCRLSSDLHIQTEFVSGHHYNSVLGDHVSSGVQVDLWWIWLMKCTWNKIRSSEKEDSLNIGSNDLNRMRSGVELSTLSGHIVNLNFCFKRRRENIISITIQNTVGSFEIILFISPKKFSLAESDRAYPSGTNV